MPKLIQTPVLSWSAPSEINAVAWGGGGDWVAAGCGRLVRVLKCVVSFEDIEKTLIMRALAGSEKR